MLHANKFYPGLSSTLSKIISMNNKVLDKLDIIQNTVDDLNERFSKFEKHDNDNEAKLYTDPGFVKVRNYTYVYINQFFFLIFNCIEPIYTLFN
jgi:dihydropteroate synthase